MKVAFIGLGVMGYPMAGHLQTAGHDVTVFNRTRARPSNGWPNMAAKPPPRRRKRPRTQEIVFCCVGRDADLREVTLGRKAAPSSR